MKFLLDENVHKGLFVFLKNLGHDVKLSPKTIGNGAVFKLALKEERLLISRDSDFVAYPPRHFGIWLLRVPPRDLESQKLIVSNLLKQFSNPHEFKNRVVKLISADDFKFL